MMVAMDDVLMLNAMTVSEERDMEDYPDKTIEITVSGKNEGTAAPYWLIIDPQQNFRCDDQGIYNIASMIEGPFFSREEAEETLRRTRYNYSKNAQVFCASGCHTEQYASKVRF